MADRHEQLPDVDNEWQREKARDAAKSVPDEDIPEGWQLQERFPEPEKNINHNRLLKIITVEGGLALSDLCWIWHLDERQDERLQFPLRQLLKGRKIRLLSGYSKRNHQLGQFYEKM